MKKQIVRILSLIMSFALIISLSIFINIETFAEVILTSNKIGTHEGYDYEFWTDVEAGSSINKAKMTLTGEGSFKSEYDTLGSKNTLMRTGKKFGYPYKTHSEYGEIICDYDVDYKPGNSGASYMCIYGWTRNDNNAPLVEFYIVEDWGAWRPPGASAKTRVTVGGVEYDIYQTVRENQPSIIGNTTFQQYWSVRVNKPSRGQNGNINAKINVSDHFKAWESLGMNMGTLYEVSLCIEGYNSTGSADVKKHVLTVGTSPEPTTEPTTDPTTEPTTEPTSEPTTAPATEPTPVPTTIEETVHWGLEQCLTCGQTYGGGYGPIGSTPPPHICEIITTEETTTEPTTEPTTESTTEPDDGGTGEPNCSRCGLCDECRQFFKKGHVLGQDYIGISDALDILMYLAGMNGSIIVQKGENSHPWNAALIVSEKKPRISDALQILMYLSGMACELNR